MFSSLVRPVAVASFCLSLCLFCANVTNAVAQSAVCSGNQTGTDVLGDSCSSSAAPGAGGPSTASAQASGPSPSSATSKATNASDATSTASNGSNSTSTAKNESSANSSAADDSVSAASATDWSSAKAFSTMMSTASAQSDNSSAAAANASYASVANSSATDSSIAKSKASQNSSAQAGASSSGNAIAHAILNSLAEANDADEGHVFAEALNNSTATASNATKGAFVCAYATNGSKASASDTSASTCSAGSGGVAVAVSPMGSCGTAVGTPCASVAASEGAPNAIIRLANPVGSPVPPFGPNYDVCAMIYVFNDNQNMGACCGCPISADGLATISVLDDLVSNWGLYDKTAAGSYVNIVATQAPDTVAVLPGTGSDNGEGCLPNVTKACHLGCDPTLAYSPSGALVGSTTTVRQIGISAPQLTEIPLEIDTGRDAARLHYMQRQCASLLANGSGTGACSCPSE